jgi:hypothetical protein
MTARSAPQVLSSRIRERQTAASTASMPIPRPWRRGQAPKPHRGAPKAQRLTAAIAVAGPSPVPSIAPDDPVSLNSTGADVPMCAFATSRIYTSLTGTTGQLSVTHLVKRDLFEGNRVERVRRAYDAKCPKLAMWQRTGARTVLIFEESDAQMTNGTSPCRRRAWSGCSAVSRAAPNERQTLSVAC